MFWQNGFHCFNTKIASHQLEKEEFTDILICFNCYKLEDHTSANCPTKEITVCSECTRNHIFKECSSEFKKCLNCGGPHLTMAMACPKKERNYPPETKLSQTKRTRPKRTNLRKSRRKKKKQQKKSISKPKELEKHKQHSNQLD